MCGIVGYVGCEQAAPILLDGLSKLEYRGYDSAGVAVRDGGGEVQLVKALGRLRVLQEKTDNGEALHGRCGIGHTRWATHGEPSTKNAHPHISDDKNVVAVHNGIVENYLQLREKLVKNGYHFYSQTDTEVIAKLIDYYYKKYRGGPIEAIARSMMRIRGSYAIAVMFKDYPDEIFAARFGAPMIVGVAENATYLASDVPAILKYTRNVYYMNDMEIARLDREGVKFCTVDQEPIEKEVVSVEWNTEAAEKGGYEHFMIKEIHEQPEAVRNTLASLIKDGRIDLSASGLNDEVLSGIDQIYIVACGSAYHVGMALQYVIEDLTRLPVRVEVASEFRYRLPVLSGKGMAIIISQSGETADSLAALREVKRQGLPVTAIVNVLGSSIAREADYVLYTLAGPEIAVATTKAYSTQLIVGYMFAMETARVRGTLSEENEAQMVAELMTIPDKIERLLEEKDRIQWFAAKYANAHDAFFIGRGIDYAIGLEGSLKLKEVSYVHSEAYAAGELKHGTISLVEKGTLVVGILTQPDLFEKMISNLAECKSRGAYLMGLTTAGNFNLEDTADFTVYVPRTDPHFTASLAVIPLQLLAYYVGVVRGLDVDKPRNLAKSVTVE